MALTPSQLRVLQTIAKNRIASGESYVAGGAALNELIGAPRLSRDIDLFHDSEDAVHWAVDADSDALRAAGYHISVEVDRNTFVEAVVELGPESCRLQWVQDSAFRFFPLVEHASFGLVLHPFDLATNKVLALVGRAVPRDWVDIIECDTRLQPLGYLVWAASGKDPGLNPSFILEQAARSARYTEVELAEVTFPDERPTAESLSLKWKQILDDARAVSAALPWQHVGECVIGADGHLITLEVSSLAEGLANGNVRFHAGSLFGAYPTVV